LLMTDLAELIERMPGEQPCHQVEE
jgi:hypothetical protein